MTTKEREELIAAKRKAGLDADQAAQVVADQERNDEHLAKAAAEKAKTKAGK